MVFSAFLRKPFNTSSQKGQAVTEYLLILVIVVGIALGVIYQLSGAFRKYVENYFGEYVACLLETGELPGLGGGGGATAEGCSGLFEPFSLKNGRPLIASNGDGAGGKNGGKSRSVNPRTSRPTSSSRVTNTRNSSPTAERGSMSGNNSNGVVASLGNKNGSRGKGGGRDSSGSLITLRRSQQQANGQFHLDGRFGMKGDEKQSGKAQKKLDAKSAKSSSPRQIAFTITDPRKMAKMNEDKPIELGLGDYLRYLIIAAIIIAIVIVLGGQLMQVRRNASVE
jgi:hypothetical protein